jgi:addiction module RelE/StbE family toxin
MAEVIWNEKFIRRYKKWVKRNPQLKETFIEKLNFLENDPFTPSLKTHSLSGNLKEHWSLSITYDYRLIFKFFEGNKDKVILIDIGTHDEVY